VPCVRRDGELYSGCEVLEQDFLSLALPVGRFDGVFANARCSCPEPRAARVLEQIHLSLKPGAFSSAPIRTGTMKGLERRPVRLLLDLDRWRALVGAASFEEIAHYYRPAGSHCNEQPWLATVWRARAK